MDSLIRDLRYGVRMLVKNPLLSGISILTFALGISLTTTVFSIVNGALLDGLPFEDSDRIVAVSQTRLDEGGDTFGADTRIFLDWQDGQTVFESMSALDYTTINVVTTDGLPVRYEAARVSETFFSILGVEAHLGRTFTASDAEFGAEVPVIISWNAWNENFNADPAVIGASLRMSDVSGTIIGVMPEGFAFPDLQELWVPLQLDETLNYQQGPGFNVIAKLRDGVSIDEAAAQIATISQRVAADFPDTHEYVGATVKSYIDMDLGDEIALFLYTMLGAVIGVLLIACANVANLLLARASLRNREVALRTALGASRFQVIRQLLAETLTLAVAGSAIGIVGGYFGVNWFSSALASDPPPAWMVFEIDFNVIMFVVGSTLFAALASGLAPALRTSQSDVAEILKDEGRGASSLRLGRFSGFLIVSEVAVSCALLVGAGLMVKSVSQLASLPLPFAVDDVITARLALPENEYPDAESRRQFYAELLPELKGIPGAADATLSDGLPAAGNGSLNLEIEGQTYQRDEDYPLIHEGIVTPGYFETFEVPVVSGRTFTTADRIDALPVAVVNETMARQHFPEGAVGSRFKIRFENRPQDWITIVGVVPDLYMEGFGEQDADDTPAGYYIPIAQTGVGNFVNIAVRAQVGNPSALVPLIRDAVQNVDRNIPIFDVRSMRDVMDSQTWFYKVFGGLFTAFGAAALFLAAVGLYGVMSFAVGSRRHEMGIRMALGARERGLIGLVMKKGLFQLGTGLGIGLAFAATLLGPLELVLYKVNARDPSVFIAIVLTLGMTGILASFIPARRVTSVDPVTAFRSD